MTDSYYDLICEKETNQVKELVFLDTRFRVFPDLRNLRTGKRFHSGKIIMVTQTVSFMELNSSFDDQSITIGLSKANNILSLSGCRMPPRYRYDGGDIDEAASYLRKQRLAKKTSGSTSAKGRMTEIVNQMVDAIMEKEPEPDVEIIHKITKSRITVSGYPDQPVMTFRVADSEKSFFGDMKDIFFGLIFVDDGDYEITSEFFVDSSDLQIRNRPTDMNIFRRRKMDILKGKFALEYYAKRTNPLISRIYREKNKQ